MEKDELKAGKEMEKTVIKALGISGGLVGGSPCAVDVKDGKIVRIKPFHYDWKYNKKEFNPWKFQRNGKTLEPLMKSLPAPFSLAYKKRTYSPNRIKYPLKRVDWDPNGERHTENRGKSKFKRISWNEAAEIIASEIKWVQEKYGPLAILAQAEIEIIKERTEKSEETAKVIRLNNDIQTMAMAIAKREIIIKERLGVVIPNPFKSKH